MDCAGAEDKYRIFREKSRDFTSHGTMNVLNTHLLLSSGEVG